MLFLNNFNNDKEWRLPPAELVELDSRDRQIISILQQNARVTVQDIASHLHITKAAVLYRIAQLEEKGVIRGYQTHFGLKRNGYSHVLAEISHPSPRQSLAAWLNEISARPETMTVFSAYGPSNTLAVVRYTTPAEKKSFSDWCYSTGARACDLHPITSAELTPLDYTNTRINLATIVHRRRSCFMDAFSRVTPRELSLTREEMTLAQILQRDARIPLSSLAEKAGLSRAKVYDTIHSWIRAGFITKFSATINPFIFPGIRFCAVWVSFREKKDTAKWKEEIIRAWNGHGFLSLTEKWDAVSFLHFFSEDEVFTFEENLRKSFPSIKNYRIDFLRSQTKLDWLAPLIISKKDVE